MGTREEEQRDVLPNQATLIQFEEERREPATEETSHVGQSRIRPETPPTTLSLTPPRLTRYYGSSLERVACPPCDNREARGERKQHGHRGGCNEILRR